MIENGICLVRFQSSLKVGKVSALKALQLVESLFEGEEMYVYILKRDEINAACYLFFDPIKYFSFFLTNSSPRTMLGLMWQR